MKADGTILIDTKIVDGGMEKGFELIKDEMASVGITAKKVGEQIQVSFSKMDVSKPVEEAMESVQSLAREFSMIDLDYQKELTLAEQMKAELEKVKQIMANAEREYTSPDVFLDAYSRENELTAAVEKQKSVVESLEKQWKSVNASLEASQKRLTTVLNKEIQKQAAAQEKASQKAIKAAEKEATAKQRAAEKQFNDLAKPARRFNSRLREIVSGALVFNLLSAGLRDMTSYFGSALKANTEFSASFAQLKGALLTAFQPIYEVVLPALLYLMRVLTALVQVAGSFFAAITGRNTAQMAKNAKDLNKQAGAISAVGDAAEEAAKQLAGFDEINRLESTSDAAAGGGGGGGVGDIMPNFEPMEITKDLERILALVGAIGAGLLAWKLASMFTDSLSTAAGLGIAVGSALLYAYNWADAFANGISWENLAGMLAGMLGLAVGLGLAFGTVGAAVGLLIGSIGIIITAVSEFNKTGEVTNEMLVALALAIAGIGAAISLVTGNWLPLIIGLLASFGVAMGITNDDIREFVGNILGWFLELWEGIKAIFSAIIESWNNIWGSISSYQTTGTIPSSTGYSVGPRSVAPDVPQLAKGAVIPPNRKFMAVLGDQTHGNNLETPESLLRQIVREESGGDERLAQLLETLISTVEGIQVGDETIGRAAARYNRSTSRARGY